MSVRLGGLSESWMALDVPARRTPVRRELGRQLVSYRRRLPERPLRRLGFACFLEALAIAVLAIPDLSTRVIASSSLLAIAVALVYFTLFRSGLSISVHEYGVHLIEGRSAEQIALFANVVRVFSQGVEHGGEIVLQLQLGDGRIITVQGRDRHLRPACEMILDRATGVISPRVLADYYAGEAVDFGAVRLSKTFISARNGRLPLRRVGEAVVRKGRFMITSDDGQTFVSMECLEVANLDALLMLLSRIRRPVAAGRSA